jgi:hypothetical protein
MRTRAERFIMFLPLMLVGAALFVFVGGEIVMRLWNWLLPSMFGFPVLTFWKALGLLVLCRLLFGGLGMAGRGGPRSRRAMRQGFFSPDEKERFKQRVREHWGASPEPEEGEPR